MSFKRHSILNDEVEEQLKGELSELWLTGMKGKEIAKELEFGIEGSPY